MALSHVGKCRRLGPKHKSSRGPRVEVVGKEFFLNIYKTKFTKNKNSNRNNSFGPPGKIIPGPPNVGKK